MKNNVLKFKILLSLSVGLMCSTAIAEEGHADSQMPPERSISPMEDFLERYFRHDSILKKAEEQSSKMSNSDIVVHFFQQGPDHKGMFPEHQILSGKHCEKSSDMEFATRWERDLDGKLRLKDATIMVGPSYSFKGRSSKGKHKRYNIPQPLIGEFGFFGLEAGKFSRSFAGADFKNALQNGDLGIETLIDESSDTILRFEIDDPKRGLGRQTVDLDESAYLNTSKGSASLMPYSVFFAPKKTPFEKYDAPLLTDKRWLRRNDFGTAIHGADKHHLVCRPSSATAGSAGCGRVKSSFAKRTFDAFKDHVRYQGGQTDEQGRLYIHEKDIHDENGKQIADKLVDTEDNLKNLKAMLAVRRRSSIKGFVPSSPVKMAEHYNSLKSPLWRDILHAHNKGELSPQVTKILNERAVVIGKLRRMSNKSGKEIEINTLKNTLEKKNAQYLDHVKHIAQAPNTRFENLHPTVQKLYLAQKQEELYRDIAKKDPSKAHLPMQKLTKEEKRFYSENEKDRYSVLADALEEFYEMHYGGNLPRKCAEQIQAYRNHVVAPTQVLRAIPVSHRTIRERASVVPRALPVGE